MKGTRLTVLGGLRMFLWRSGLGFLLLVPGWVAVEKSVQGITLGMVWGGCSPVGNGMKLVTMGLIGSAWSGRNWIEAAYGRKHHHIAAIQPGSISTPSTAA